MSSVFTKDNFDAGDYEALLDRLRGLSQYQAGAASREMRIIINALRLASTASATEARLASATELLRELERLPDAANRQRAAAFLRDAKPEGES